MQNLPITYPGSRKKTFILLLVSILFVFCGIVTFKESTIISILGIAFFGLGSIVFMINLLPKASYLTLTSEGFEFSSLFRRHFETWADIDLFFPVRISLPYHFGGVKKMVGWNYRQNYRKSSKMRNISSWLSGAEAALPDTYGKSVEELCDIMNELCSKYDKPAA